MSSSHRISGRSPRQRVPELVLTYSRFWGSLASAGCTRWLVCTHRPFGSSREWRVGVTSRERISPAGREPSQ